MNEIVDKIPNNTNWPTALVWVIGIMVIGWVIVTFIKEMNK